MFFAPKCRVSCISKHFNYNLLLRLHLRFQLELTNQCFSNSSGFNVSANVRARTVVLNLSSFEAHFQCQKNTRPTKLLTQILSVIKCFLTTLQVSKFGSRLFLLLFVVYLAHFLTFFLALVCLKKLFNCFFNCNESALVIDHLNSAKRSACFLALAY